MMFFLQPFWHSSEPLYFVFPLFLIVYSLCILLLCGLFGCVLVSGTLAFHLLYLDVLLPGRYCLVYSVSQSVTTESVSL